MYRLCQKNLTLFSIKESQCCIYQEDLKQPLYLTTFFFGSNLTKRKQIFYLLKEAKGKNGLQKIKIRDIEKLFGNAY